MTEPYTPSTAIIREGHAFFLQHKFSNGTFGQGLAEFDRWLAAHDAEVRRTALLEAAKVTEDATEDEVEWTDAWWSYKKAAAAIEALADREEQQ